ncbi:MAG: hypothetical protein H6734_27595 [Alphaproteobacteria bacterium]|nr:hypothetical protein [Alphaproteobacteria bacterium]
MVARRAGLLLELALAWCVGYLAVRQLGSWAMDCRDTTWSSFQVRLLSVSPPDAAIDGTRLDELLPIDVEAAVPPAYREPYPPYTVWITLDEVPFFTVGPDYVVP